MSEVKALSGAEAATKIKHIAAGEIAMFCTFSDERMRTRPMGTAAIDDNGTLWFLSKMDSTKNLEISSDPRVHLIYSVPSRSEYLSLEGMASITRDQTKINEIWSVFAKTWFTEGQHDPSITVLKVVPFKGHYWDTKHNKMIQLGAIAVGALLGTTLDDGVQGDLEINPSGSPR